MLKDKKIYLTVVLYIFVVMIIFMHTGYAATSYGNTTIYDYDTNSTLTDVDTVYFDCNLSGLDANLTIDADLYTGTNELEMVTAYYQMSNGTAIEENLTDYGYANRTRVVIGFNQTQFFNMTWDGASKSWKVLVSNNESDDITLYFMANSKSFECINTTVEMKIRPAFYYTIHFYKGANASTDVKPYKNEFQYVYMRFYNDSTSWTDSTMFRDMSYLDRMFKGLPFYKASFSVKTDDELTFWSRYNDGEARIKLYEDNRDYSVYLMTDDTYGLSWDDEFTRPQLQDYSWQSKVINKISILDAGDKTLGIYLSRWEINKFMFLMNIGYWVVVIGLWLVVVLLCASHASFLSIIVSSAAYFIIMRGISTWLFI